MNECDISWMWSLQFIVGDPISLFEASFNFILWYWCVYPENINKNLVQGSFWGREGDWLYVYSQIFKLSA